MDESEALVPCMFLPNRMRTTEAVHKTSGVSACRRVVSRGTYERSELVTIRTSPSGRTSVAKSTSAFC